MDSKTARQFLQLLLLFAGLAVSPLSLAQWQVVEETDTVSGVTTPLARIRNDTGYSLAVYRDSNNRVYVRFMLNDRLTRLAPNYCPTYQIDERQPHNKAANGSDCRNQARTSEYALGRIEDNTISSRSLYEFMNGSHIDWRFRLNNGAYDDTRFSLSGSKQALSTVLGRDLQVLPGKQN